MKVKYDSTGYIKKYICTYKYVYTCSNNEKETKFEGFKEVYMRGFGGMGREKLM